MNYGPQTRDRYRTLVAVTSGVTTFTAFAATGALTAVVAHQTAAERAEQERSNPPQSSSVSDDRQARPTRGGSRAPLPSDATGGPATTAPGGGAVDRDTTPSRTPSSSSTGTAPSTGS